MSTSATAPDPTKEGCEKGRDDAFDVLNKDQAEYDKQLLALSAGFLAVSLAFIKDVVPLKYAAHIWAFDWSLGLLFLCICFVLGTFQYGIHAHLELADYWKGMGESCDEVDETKRGETRNKLEVRRIALERRHNSIKWLNWIAGCLFVSGILLLVFFVVTNVDGESHLSGCAPDAPSYNSSVQHPQGPIMDASGGRMASNNSGKEFTKIEHSSDVQRAAHLKIPPAPQPQPNQAPAQPAQPQSGGGNEQK